MSERYITNHDLTLWTIAQGVGDPIILCNGGAGCCDYLQPVADMLTDLARVVRFEQRGCGRSQPASSYSVQTSIEDVEAVQKAYEIDRCIVGGHSWGADLALVYALTYPERVTGLLCLAGGRMNNDREWHAEYDRKREDEGELLPDFAYPVNVEVNQQVGRSFKRYIQRPTLFRNIAELTCPALFVYGDRDIRPSWPVQQIASLLPNGRFTLMEGAAHCLWLTHDQELRKVIRPFITELTHQITER
jgi:proline iminopeptidase